MMAELRKAAGVDVPLVESLVKAHFGPDFTAKLSYSVTKGRYVPSDLPRRLAAPQKLFGVRLWWTTIGAFSDNIGFRLELWQPEYLSQAEALIKAYNARTEGTPLELYNRYPQHAASARPTAA
jgi:hypothetical protein